MSPSGQTICLNMIVKNEAGNLERCLRAVADHIGCWVICDTGSTDGTPNLIRTFFAARHISGELHEFAFETFEQARNQALDCARSSKLAFDYLLLTDADMEFKLEEPDALRDLRAPAYHLRQDSGISYWNVRLLRRDLPAIYRGVTHEYLDLKGAQAEHLLGASFIDHATGANRVDKYERDARLLRTALTRETDPGLVARYTFYLANTLRDADDAAAALPVYLDRAELGYWHEEVYVSLLNAARIKEKLTHPDEDVIALYTRAAATCPTRAEALHGAARFCRNNGRHRQGYDFAVQGLAVSKPQQALFSEDWVYETGLLDEMAVNAYWVGQYERSADACRTLLEKPTLSGADKDRITRNLEFALVKIAEGAGASDLAPAPWAASSIAWQPDRPLAGTELMVEALRARLGGEVDGIDLRVNLYDPATLDDRPLVVWIHHDVDQAAVQWCRDPALTDRVACFVFVSYWQRERYVAAFDLRPERCAVIRHALAMPTPSRVWEPAPVLRCAYTSTPFRGLDILLDAWERLPDGRAELHIWSSMKLYRGDDTPYLPLLERARSMPGVVYHGLAPNAELRAALRTMHFLTYPNTFAETACVAVIEAMAAGCRIIVPSHGALPETTGGYARVYPWCPDRSRHVAMFSDVLADEFADPWSGRLDDALGQQAHCATVYAWERCLGEWRRLIATLRAAPPAAIATACSTLVQAGSAPQETRVTRALLRLRDGGFAPAGIIDVGAHDGAFARAARQVFPAARILMIDALPEKKPVLEQAAREVGNAASLVALLGERDGEATPFFVVDTTRRPDLVKTGSSAFRENSNFPMTELSIAQRRLDAVLAEYETPCTFIKLDVQGGELSVIRGLGERLADVEVILTEMSLVAYNEGAPLIASVIGELGDRGFVLFDIVEEHRYRDGNLLQIDGIFVRHESKLRAKPPFWT